MTHQKSESKNKEVLSVIFQPFEQITYQNILVINHIVTQELTYIPMKELVSPDKMCTQEAATSEKAAEPTGLDCSGQGQCQPNSDITDTNRMQDFLVKANRKADNRNKMKRKK